MAYDLFDELIVANSVTGATSGDRAELCVGSAPIIVRSIHVTTQTDNSTSAAVIAFVRRPTAGSTTGEVTIGTITIPTTAVRGRVYYKSGFNVRLLPGESILVRVTTAGGAGFTSFTGSVNVERYTEVPANVPNMFLSA